MNNVNIIGRIAYMPEVKQTSSGKTVCNFRIAVDAGKDKEAYFFPVVAWNATAENIAKYFKKGDKIAISGLLTSRSYVGEDEQKHNVIEILANGFDFCSSKAPEKSAAEKPEEKPEATDASALPFEI